MSFAYVAFTVTLLGGLGFQNLIESDNKEKFYRRFIIFCGVFLGLSILVSLLISPMVSLISGILKDPQKISALKANYSQIPLGFFKVFLFSGGFLFLTYLLLQKKIRYPLFTLLAGGVVLFDLWSIHWKFLNTGPRPENSPHFIKDEVVQYLEKDKDLYRVFPLFYRTDDNYLMWYNIQSIGGHHPNPMKRYQEYIGSPKSVMFRPNNISNLLKYPKMVDLLNVKYILTQPIPQDLSPYPPEARSILQVARNFLDDPRLKLVKGTGQFFVYENTDFLPRAFLVPEVRVVPEENILQELQSDNFDPREVALIEEEPQMNLPEEDTLEGNVKVLEWNPNRIILETESNIPSFLVYSENYYPYFKAKVDEKQEKVYRTNYILRGIFVPKGKHTITFYFDTYLIRLGGLFTLLSLILILGGIIITKKKYSKPKTL